MNIKKISFLGILIIGIILFRVIRTNNMNKELGFDKNTYKEDINILGVSEKVNGQEYDFELDK